jgi:flagellar protein FliO/FliZ
METITLIGRVMVSLAVVLGVMWVIARRARGGVRKRSGQLIDVLARQQVGRGSTVAVVRIGEQAFIVGVTDTQVSLLAETDLEAAQAYAAETDGRGKSRTRHSQAGRVTGGGAHTARAIRGSRTTTRGARSRAAAVIDAGELRPNALAGSALSPATWKQTIESLRDLTARTD